MPRYRSQRSYVSYEEQSALLYAWDLRAMSSIILGKSRESLPNAGMVKPELGEGHV